MKKVLLGIIILNFSCSKRKQDCIINENDEVKSCFEKILKYPLPVGDSEVVTYYKREFYDYSQDVKKEDDLPRVDVFVKNLSKKLKEKGVDIGSYFTPDSFYYAVDTPLILANPTSVRAQKYKILYRLLDKYTYRLFIVVPHEFHVEICGISNPVYLICVDRNDRITSYIILSYRSNQDLNPAQFCLNYDHSDYDDTKYIYEGGWGFRSFYIDKDYIIHTKYFTGFEGGMTVAASENYQIASTGKIVRYFEEEDNPHYVGRWERGAIQNHVKEGLWIEHLGGTEGMWTKSHYRAGILVGIQEFYLLLDNEERSCLLYTLDVASRKITSLFPNSHRQDLRHGYRGPCEISDDDYRSMSRLMKKSIRRLM